MVWLVVVCGCDRGELFRCGLSALNVLNNCDVVSWMRCGSAWSRFAFSWDVYVVNLNTATKINNSTYTTYRPTIHNHIRIHNHSLQPLKFTIQTYTFHLFSHTQSPQLQKQFKASYYTGQTLQRHSAQCRVINHRSSGGTSKKAGQNQEDKQK